MTYRAPTFSLTNAERYAIETARARLHLSRAAFLRLCLSRGIQEPTAIAAEVDRIDAGNGLEDRPHRWADCRVGRREDLRRLADRAQTTIGNVCLAAMRLGARDVGWVLGAVTPTNPGA